jgi:hypothetical protein
MMPLILSYIQILELLSGRLEFGTLGVNLKV